jgi:hypothetical protein
VLGTPNVKIMKELMERSIVAGDVRRQTIWRKPEEILLPGKSASQPTTP